MYKAGDFTNGKMNEIFKKCGAECAVKVSHKQFGDTFLLSEDFVADSAIKMLLSNSKFNDFYRDSLVDLSRDEQLQEVSEYFGINFCDWGNMLFIITYSLGQS